MGHPRQRPGGRSARIAPAVHRATIAALLDHGVAGLRIEDIAGRAGVNKSTIYRRWGSRERLLADALVANSGRQITVPDAGNVRDDLLALALQVRDAVVAPAIRALMGAVATGRPAAEAEEVGTAFWSGRLRAVRPIVDRAVHRGELPADVDPDRLIERIVGPIWFAVFGPRMPVDDATVTDTVDIVLAGYRARPAVESRHPLPVGSDTPG